MQVGEQPLGTAGGLVVGGAEVLGGLSGGCGLLGVCTGGVPAGGGDGGQDRALVVVGPDPDLDPDAVDRQTR